MTAYFDSSAMASAADAVFTAVVSRAEVAAALAPAVRTGRITQAHGKIAQAEFLAHWEALARVAINDKLVAEAERIAWKHGLRGYDAVQLAAAAAAQDTVGEGIVMVTFDRRLWQAARSEGFSVWPVEKQL